MPRKRKDLPMYRGRTEVAIARYGRLAPMKKMLDERYGEGQWGRDQVVDLMDERDRIKSGAAQEKASAEEIKNNSRASRVGKRYARYLSAYSNVTPNDEILFRELAEIEQQLDEQIGRTYEKESERQGAAKIRISLIAEHRKIQEQLGIARNQREGELDQESALRRLVEGSRALIDKRSVRLDCPNCLSLRRKINLGFIMYHFHNQSDWTFATTCPRCGEPIVLQGRDQRSELERQLSGASLQIEAAGSARPEDPHEDDNAEADPADDRAASV